jgi:PAS domain S-box-containing protein
MMEQKDFRYKAIFDETVEAIIITDGSSEKIVDINKAGCELFAAEKEELIGDFLYNFLKGNPWVKNPKSPSEITMFGNVLSNKIIKSKTGELTPVDLTINTFSDNEDNYVMTSLRDVSERFKYENEILKMNEELNKTNASKDKLFSIIAHDLKNPISALIGLSEMMTSESETVSSKEVIEFSGMIQSLSKNTYELLENLLNWSRIQTKNIAIDKGNFELKNLVDKIIDVLKPSADLKKINFENLVKPGFIIYADENMISTVIRNFISNSIKFSPNNSTISIAGNENDNKWDISVKDNGIGMDESYIADLFKIDVNTSRYGTNKEKGTGLGLLLCSEFVKLHNGNILVNSKINQGSEFIIQLPKEDK